MHDRHVITAANAATNMQAKIAAQCAQSAAQAGHGYRALSTVPHGLYRAGVCRYARGREHVKGCVVVADVVALFFELCWGPQAQVSKGAGRMAPCSVLEICCPYHALFWESSPLYFGGELHRAGKEQGAK